MCRASKRGEDQQEIICAGLAQKSTSKAEDVCAVTITNDVSIAAVLDGHGGKNAAEPCKNELVPTLLQVAHNDSSAIVDAAIEGAFWDIDESLGMEGIDDGTTGIGALVQQKKEKLECLLAFVGDSAGIRVDMTAKTEAGALVPGCGQHDGQSRAGQHKTEYSVYSSDRGAPAASSGWCARTGRASARERADVCATSNKYPLLVFFFAKK